MTESNIQNKFETEYVNANASVEGIANSLAEYYAFYRDTKLINQSEFIYELDNQLNKMFSNSRSSLVVTCTLEINLEIIRLCRFSWRYCSTFLL